MGPLDRVEDERLVLAIRAGDKDAFGQLFDRWYDRVHDLARRITRDDGLAADVAQDTFLAAWQRLDGLDDPASFGGWVLRIARNRALDVVRSPAHARTEADDEVSTTVDEQAAAARLTDLDDPAEVAGDREVQELVWSAAATLGERDLTALDLSLRHGLEPAEIGEVLGINRNAANQLVHRMKGRLATAVRSRVLWRGGAPACAALQAALDEDGLDRFDARAVRVADRHASDCEDCTRRRDTRLDPAHLFAAVPIAAAPVLLKAKAAAALEAAGVPMGSAGGAGGPGAGSSGEGPDNSAPPDPTGPHDPPRRRRRRPSRRAVALGTVALVVVALVIAVLAVESIDHDTPVVAAEGAPVATTAPESDGSPRSGPTTTTEPQISITVEPDPVAEEDLPGPSGEAPPVVTPDPVTPPPGNPVPPPSPPPAAPTAELSISPSHLAPTVSSGAVLSWSTGNATTVSVSGSGVSSSAPSGSQTVCPGSSGSVCIPAVGTYTYVLTASGPGGSVQRSVTLTVS